MSSTKAASIINAHGIPTRSQLDGTLECVESYSVRVGDTVTHHNDWIPAPTTYVSLMSWLGYDYRIDSVHAIAN